MTRSRLAHAGGVAVLLFVAAAPSVDADVLRVPQDFPTIGAAVAAVNNGDRIVISAGTYPETVEMIAKQDVTIRAKGKVTMKSPSPLAVTEVMRFTFCQRCSLIGIRVQLGAGELGVSMVTSTDCKAVRCSVTGGQFGFSIGTCARTTIDHCSVSGADYGVSIDSTSAVVRDCRVKDAGIDGLRIQSKRAIVRRNRVTGGQGDAIHVTGNAQFAVLTGNIVRDPTGAAIRFDSVDTGGWITNNRVTGGGDGFVGSGDHLSITENTFRDCTNAAIVIESDELAVIGNRIRGCGVGIVIDDLVMKTLCSDNVIRDAQSVGIRLDVGAAQNVVTANFAKKSGEFDFRDDSGQFNDVFDNRFGSVGP